MKIIQRRREVHLIFETEADMAFVEDTLHFRKDGDYAHCTRITRTIEGIVLEIGQTKGWEKPLEVKEEKKSDKKEPETLSEDTLAKWIRKNLNNPEVTAYSLAVKMQLLAGGMGDTSKVIKKLKITTHELSAYFAILTSPQEIQELYKSGDITDPDIAYYVMSVPASTRHLLIKAYLEHDFDREQMEGIFDAMNQGTPIDKAINKAIAKAVRPELWPIELQIEGDIVPRLEKEARKYGLSVAEYLKDFIRDLHQ